jgi:hypothetical protein
MMEKFLKELQQGWYALEEVGKNREAVFGEMTTATQSIHNQLRLPYTAFRF